MSRRQSKDATQRKRNQPANQEAAAYRQTKHSSELAATIGGSINYAVKIIWLLSHVNVPWRWKKMLLGSNNIHTWNARPGRVSWLHQSDRLNGCSKLRQYIWPAEEVYGCKEAASWREYKCCELGGKREGTVGYSQFLDFGPKGVLKQMILWWGLYTQTHAHTQKILT